MRKVKQSNSFLAHVIGLFVLFMFFAGCNNQKNKDADLSKTVEEENKAFLLAFTEDFFNKQNIAVFEKYYSTNCIVHFTSGDQNFEQYKVSVQGFFAALPDLHITTEDLIAEGEKVAKLWSGTGTHKAELFGIPATEKKIVLKGIEIFRIEDGKIVEVWVSWDVYGIMQQLGAFSPKEG